MNMHKKLKILGGESNMYICTLRLQISIIHTHGWMYVWYMHSALGWMLITTKTK